MTTKTETLTCLLAIARSTDANGFDAAGFEPGSVCRVIGIGNLAAIVTDVPTEQLVGEQAEQLLNDPDWLAPRALAHDAAIRAAWEKGPVMPMPFGVAFAADDSLVAKLQTHAESVADFLETTAGHTEIPIRVELDRETALDAIARHNVAELQTEGDGASYLLERQAKARAVEELEDYIENHTGELADILEAVTTDAIERETTRTDEGVVRTWAFLVPNNALDAFNEKLAAANNTGKRTGFILTAGQAMPPYSFCPTLEELN